MESITEKNPTKVERERCWKARDLFFQCLDNNSIIDPLTQFEEVQKKCLLQEENFKKECLKSWVEYFKKKRVIDIQKEHFYKNLNKKEKQ